MAARLARRPTPTHPARPLATAEALVMADGTVVTFYSYKGGVGRTLALANVAAALAAWGYRVLCVDWDLEAPGLSYYFHQWIKAPSFGLVDLIEDVAAGEPPDVQRATMTLPLPGLEDRLALIPAGRQDATFASRVQRIDWTRLYEEYELGAALEQMRTDWLGRFDFVLIDSRTGITDIGGICTVQLPDILAVMFTANHQSLDGAIEVAQRAIKARSELPYDRARLLIFPIPSRFDAREEYDHAVRWQRTFVERLPLFYADWAVKETTPEQLLERTTLPYFARWSFGEELPIVTETTRGPDFISYHLETLAAVVAHRLARSDLLVESRDSYVDAARRAGLRGGRFEYDILISFTLKDRKAARELADHLRSFNLSVFLEDQDVKSGEDWIAESDRNLARSQHLVVMVGEEMTRWQRRQAERFVKQTVDEKSERTVIPVLVAGASPSTLPSLVQRTESYDTQQLSVRSIAAHIALAALSGASNLGQANAAQSLTNVGKVLYDLRELPAAREAFEHALAIRQDQLGPDHPDAATSLCDLGNVLYGLGELTSARQAFERAVAIREAKLGPDHPDVAISLNNLGNVFSGLGELTSARQAFERALAIREAKLGPEHPALATSLSNLGNVLYRLGELEAARVNFEHALAIRQDQLGPDHPDVADSLSNLGNVLYSLGELEAARVDFERALAIRRDQLGPDHPTVATSLNNLALVLRGLGELAAARHAQQRALAIYEARLGPDHPLTTQTRRELAALGTGSGGSQKVFISFDYDHDLDLKNVLVGQSKLPDSSFNIADWSIKDPSSDWKEKARQRIRRVDQVAVICGEHTDTATGVSEEIRIARDEEKPYFLLKGRADTVCRKPKAALKSDKMYRWTWENLKKLIAGDQ
jgi:tetratricopeptide (TPR) repeat protein/Mrp family chromosome partitioning ATPase